MKKIILPLAFLALVSCSKDDQLTPTERNVIGAWNYEEVRFTETWSFGSDDLTAGYSDITLTFYDDFTVTTLNTQTMETQTGIWEVNLVESYDNNGGTNWGEQLIASLASDQTGEITQLIWENLAVNKRRMNCSHNNKEGWYHFRLEKL